MKSENKLRRYKRITKEAKRDLGTHVREKKKKIECEGIKIIMNPDQNNEIIEELVQEYFQQKQDEKPAHVFDSISNEFQIDNQFSDFEKIFSDYSEICKEKDFLSPILLLEKSDSHCLLKNQEFQQISSKTAKVLKNFSQISSVQKSRAVFNEKVSQIRGKIQMRGNILHGYFEESQARYFMILARKMYNHSLSEQPIDYLNFFKYAAHCQQDKLYQKYQPITSEQQLIDYLSKRKNKFRKAAKFLLHTACNSCMSPYFQQSNPLVNCPQCHLRLHTFCLNLNKVNRCGRCIYNRIPIKQREGIEECFICNNRNLVAQRVGSKLFAHTFCLLGHKLETISSNTIQLNASELKKYQEDVDTCCICEKQSKFLVKCKQCKKNQHLLCSFLEGSSIIENEQDYLPEVNCCIEKTRKENLGKKRKFILNYNNEAYNFGIKKKK